MKNETNIHVPKKYVEAIESIEKDDDGYWAYTKAGYMFPSMECHTAHEDTQAELLAVIRTVAPCECDRCKEYLNRKKGSAK